jgi:hypothetical protein
MTVGAGIFVTMLVSNAFAGCGDLNLTGPEFAQASETSMVPKSDQARASAGGGLGASIAGMWKVQLISKGNTGHNPSIPDGALIDFGFMQWHSDEQKSRIPLVSRVAASVWAYGGRLGFSHSSSTIFRSRSTRRPEQSPTISISVNKTRALPAATAILALLPRTSTTPRKPGRPARGNRNGDANDRGFCISKRPPHQLKQSSPRGALVPSGAFARPLAFSV